MVASADAKPSLESYRDTVAKLLGHADVHELETSLDSNYQSSYVLVYMWMGVTDTVRTYKATDAGRDQMLEDFTDKVKDRLNVLPDGSLSSEDQCILDDAIDAMFYEDSKSLYLATKFNFIVLSTRPSSDGFFVFCIKIYSILVSIMV